MVYEGGGGLELFVQVSAAGLRGNPKLVVSEEQVTSPSYGRGKSASCSNEGELSFFGKT